MFVIQAAVSALLIAGGASAATFSVATPSSLQECTPYLISWTGGQAPYIPQITSPGEISDILETLATTNDTSVSWTVDQPAGNKITINIVDSTGATASSAISPSIAVGSTSCQSSSASATGSGASTAASSSSAASGSTSSAASGSTSSAAGGSSSSSSAGTTTTSSASTDGASNIRGFAAVAAGAVGVVVAALV